MAPEEQRRGAASTKASKKGGNNSKELMAEQEARRREEVRGKLRETLELEERALKIVERLLEDSVTEDVLVDCAKFITPSYYKDAVEERFIVKLCGYPICPNKLLKIPTQQYKISTRTNKVYDISERKCFCSNFCYKASKEFELQISKTPLWLRQHESPPEVKLKKKGDNGSSGEEVVLSQKWLQEEDIENPSAAQSAHHHSLPTHSDSSDLEQEQDFVSSVVSRHHGPRVHWGDLPDRSGEAGRGQRGKKTTREKLNGVVNGENKHRLQCRHKEKEAGKTSEKDDTTDSRTDAERLLEQGKCAVEETTAKMDQCSLSGTATPTVPTLGDLTDAQQTTVSNPETENTPPSYQNSPSAADPGLHITQVGMSKKGAAGLRDLLKIHNVAPKPESVHLNLFEHLKRTLKEWITEETSRFLYGADGFTSSTYTEEKEEDEEKEDEEELDEDDIEEEVKEMDFAGADAGVVKRPSAPVPDYQALRKETQQLELRVKEFYKGTWILPEEEEGAPGKQKVSVKDQGRTEPVLPLVDSQAQHIIQKRIAVEKLSNCLRNIVGPLRLTMSDVSPDLNKLVRTFRFTNTNIIHKTPEWTLIAVILLHMMSEVCVVVREALEVTASVDYLNSLMKELGLEERDLSTLVHMLKRSKYSE